MKSKTKDRIIHAILISVAFVTMLPFLFVINNSLRTNSEMYHAFFGLPNSIKNMVRFTWQHYTGNDEQIIMKVSVEDELGQTSFEEKKINYDEAMALSWERMTRGYKYSWGVLRGYMLNSFFVCIVSMFGVIFIASITAYIFARYKFPGRNFLFMAVLSFMMIPAVLTLVPSFLLVKQLGLLNSYWVLILPYIATGQIFAIFLFRSFFDGLPEDLFESARIDGAGHLSIYWNVVLPLSKPVIAVVAVLNIMGNWNNFLWPFITNSDAQYHVVASGLYLMGQSQMATNFSTMYSAYVLSSIPLLILFIYATKPFMQGVTSGAFKA